MKRGIALVALTCLLAAGAAAGIRLADPALGASQPVRLTLVAYSTPRDAFAELIKAFQATPAGAGVTFDESYGGSGEQSRAVLAGLPADVVAFSLEPDIARLVDGGLVASTWNQNPTGGMITRSVVVFIVRKGNPKHITGWSDLVKPGIEVITPNPFTSGGARWNIAAAYGAQLKAGRTPDQAAAYLQALFSHITVQDKSAREALQTFVGGKGDVMLAYESEAFLAQHKGMNVDYLVPQPSILIENPMAVTSSTQHPTEARAFLAFLLSKDGQRIFSQWGYRPVIALNHTDPNSKQSLFTISALGGWKNVDKQLFDPDSGLVAKIEQNLGLGSAGR